jgi:uncharacterized membrane protein
VTAADTTAGIEEPSLADAILKGSAVLWFLVAVVGQWLFVYYIAAFFGPPTLAGDFAAWDRNKLMPHGHVPGDAAGNLALAAHFTMAAIITLGGTLQLIPQIRDRAIWFHRWNGRLFIVVAFAITLAGLFLHAVRGTSVVGGAAIGLNAVLIMFCAAQAFGHARARDIDAHRRWALRAYMTMNGVWFLRVGFSAWIITTQGLAGPPKFDFVFFIFWGFGSYLVPLAVLELYLRSEGRPGALAKLAVATLIVALTGVMAIGIFGAYMIFWGPLLA